MDMYAAADRVHLAVIRHLALADVVEPLDRTAVLSEVVRRLARDCDRQVELALSLHESQAAIGRAMGVTRQAVHKRYVARNPSTRSPTDLPASSGPPETGP